jgi:hypothetical protein
VGFNQLINGSGECLGVASGSQANGATVVGWSCLGPTHLDQYWAGTDGLMGLPPGGCSGAELLLNANSDKVLGVVSNSLKAGAAVVEWDYQLICNNQFWFFPSVNA